MNKVSIILPYYNRKKYLVATLDGFQLLYGGNTRLEIVIVDDCSSEENRIDDIVGSYKLNINYVRISENTGINPCYVYNVGVRESTGDVLILSSPEIFHINNIFEISNNFKGLADDKYFLFSVFCLTEKTILEKCLDGNVNINEKINEIKTFIPEFYKNLGINGYPFNNNYGSWYLHSKFRKSYLNFCTALTKNLYYELSGFDERFRYGTEYDDNEFLDRVKQKINKYVWFDEFVSIHFDHPVAATMGCNSNLNLYNSVKSDVYEKNDNWGRL